MAIMTAAEFTRNVKSTLDRLEFSREEIIIIRNKRRIARILPGSNQMTALEAMEDLHRTLPINAADGWLEESRIPGIAATVR